MEDAESKHKKKGQMRRVRAKIKIPEFKIDTIQSSIKLMYACIYFIKKDAKPKRICAIQLAQPIQVCNYYKSITTIFQIV